AAPPDGICVSRGVRDAANGKVSIEFENRGELEVKNIPEPVGAYGVIFDPVAWTMEPPQQEAPKRASRRGLVVSAAAVLLIALAGLSWLALGRSSVTNILNAQGSLRERL